MKLALPPELCRHHDIIAIPNGPISIGTCKKCGRQREYANHKWPDYNSQPLNEPSTTAVGRKLKRDWGEPLEWKEPERNG